MSPNPILGGRTAREEIERAERERHERDARASHPAYEPSDTPGGFPPGVRPGAGPRSPTIDRSVTPMTTGQRLNEVKLILGGLGAIGGAVLWLATRTLDAAQSKVAAIAASAAASAVQERFDYHPPDAFGRPLPSLSERLSKAADLVEWAGHEADAQARLEHRIDVLEAKAAELDKPRKGPR